MRAGLLTVCLSLFCCTVPSWAQDGRSRRYLPIPFDGDLEAMLRDPLAQASDWDDFLKRLPAGLKKLTPQIERMKDDERFRDLLRLLSEQKLDKIRWPQDLKDLEKVIKGKIEKQLLPPVVDKPVPGMPGNGAAPPQPPAFMKPGTQPQRRLDAQDRFERWLKDRLKDAEDSNIGDMLRDSPAWQKTLEDLRRSLGDMRVERWNLDGVLERAPFVDKVSLPSISLPEIAVPDLPDLKAFMPAIRFENPLGGMDIPRLSVSRTPGGVTMAIWLLAAAAAVFLLWQVWKSLDRRGQLAVMAWTPGPWPMLPADINTRAHLVICFEYLSLLLLGKQAATFNHRTIAERLASAGDGGRRQTANELASLYEWARYAPGDGPLPPERQAFARTALEYFAQSHPGQVEK